MTKILGLFLFFLLSLFLRDGVEKHLIFKNRVPIGQVEQQIVYSMSSITQKKFNSLRRSGKLTLNNDLKSTVLDGRYDFSGDSIFILQSNFRGLLDKDFSEINFGYNISKFLQGKYLWNTKNIPFDSLYSVHLDSTFIIQVPYGSRSKFYCIEFYDPCPKFGPQIFSDFCNVYRSYITFYKLSPSDSTAYKPYLQQLENRIEFFLKKYPNNPYVSSITFFLMRSLGGSFNSSTRREYFDYLFSVYSKRDELFDTATINLLSNFFKLYHQKYKLGKMDSIKYFEKFNRETSDSKSLFWSCYDDFIKTLN